MIISKLDLLEAESVLIPLTKMNKHYGVLDLDLFCIATRSANKFT